MGPRHGPTTLRGTDTEANLRAAFGHKAETSSRYQWLASQAEVEGHPELAELCRQLATREVGHAFGHLDLLAESLDGDAEGSSIVDQLAAIVRTEETDAPSRYPSYARTAHDEGFPDVGAWMETVAKADAQQAERLREHLVRLAGPEEGR